MWLLGVCYKAQKRDPIFDRPKNSGRPTPRRERAQGPMTTPRCSPAFFLDWPPLQSVRGTAALVGGGAADDDQRER